MILLILLCLKYYFLNPEPAKDMKIAPFCLIDFSSFFCFSLCHSWPSLPTITSQPAEILEFKCHTVSHQINLRLRRAFFRQPNITVEPVPEQNLCSIWNSFVPWLFLNNPCVTRHEIYGKNFPANTNQSSRAFIVWAGINLVVSFSSSRKQPRPFSDDKNTCSLSFPGSYFRHSFLIFILLEQGKMEENDLPKAILKNLTGGS